MTFISFFTRFGRGLLARFSTLSIRGKMVTISVIILTLVALVAGFRMYAAAQAGDTVIPTKIQTVTLLPAGDFAAQADGLEVTGTLRSKSEADVRFEMPGRVTGVYAKVGNHVARGALIAEVENSAQRAAVTQALGGLQSAQANAKAAAASLAKVQGGTREEQLRVLESTFTSAEAAQAAALQTAENALESTYATIEQSIIYGTDTLFNNPTRYNPKLEFSVFDADLRNEISAMRVDIRKITDRQKELVGTTPSDIYTELTTVLEELEYINTFFSKIFTALEETVISGVEEATYAATVSTARTSVLGAISTITAAHNGLLQADNQVAIAEANYQQGTTGAQDEDVLAAEAQKDAADAAVTTARGSYSAALSALEKTRVRASISGTLASFSATTGDFVGTQALGRILGSGGSEVVFYIPSSDSTRVAVGDDVLVANSYNGTVTTVASDASGLSGQLEVRADLNTKPTDVTNNSTVAVRILTKDAATTVAQDILLPLNAIKFTASETSIFTVADADAATSTTTMLPVTLGTVVGDMVVVTGIEAATPIVRDARGLRDAQLVEIAN